MFDQRCKSQTEYESILDAEELTDEIWDKFISDVRVFAGPRLEITWKFDKIGDIAVKTSFADTDVTLEQRLEHYIRTR